jgi:arylsulfatase A-like enzyme
MTDAGAKRPNILILMVDQLNGTLFPTVLPSSCTRRT